MSSAREQIEAECMDTMDCVPAPEPSGTSGRMREQAAERVIECKDAEVSRLTRINVSLNADVIAADNRTREATTRVVKVEQERDELREEVMMMKKTISETYGTKEGEQILALRERVRVLESEQEAFVRDSADYAGEEYQRRLDAMVAANSNVPAGESWPNVQALVSYAVELLDAIDAHCAAIKAAT